jgi:hypothetical protein
MNAKVNMADQADQVSNLADDSDRRNDNGSCLIPHGPHF